MPCGKLTLGQNSTEIMSSDKSNSAAMFLRIQTDIYDNVVYTNVTCTVAFRSDQKVSLIIPVGIGSPFLAKKERTNNKR